MSKREELARHDSCPGPVDMDAPRAVVGAWYEGWASELELGCPA
jgi:hypothetical protein